MYIIDKLEQLQGFYRPESTEAVLASYLLNHIGMQKKLSLKQVTLETHLSRSSVIRFCHHLGYDGYTIFIERLMEEVELMENSLMELDRDDTSFQQLFLDMANVQIDRAYDSLFQSVLTSSRIIFCGYQKYIACFSLLTFYFRFLGREVINHFYWDADSPSSIEDQLSKDDLIFILSPQLSWRDYQESIMSNQEAFDNLYQISGQIAFIGQPGEQAQGVFIPVPYTSKEALYQKIMIDLDSRLVRDLKRHLTKCQ